MKRMMKLPWPPRSCLQPWQRRPGSQAQQSAMTFFISSAGSGNGGNLGGLEGADALCQKLAKAAGATAKTWRAYLSTTGAKSVNARDRIGRGPWQNAKGEVVARTLDDLHSDKNNLNKQTALTETGQVVNGRGDKPNMHDILTGSDRRKAARSAAATRTRPATTGPARRRLGHRRASRPPGPRHVAADDVLEFVAPLEGLQPAGAGLDRRQRPDLLLRRELIEIAQSRRPSGTRPAAVVLRSIAPAQTPWRSARRSRAASRRSAPPPCRPPGPDTKLNSTLLFCGLGEEFLVLPERRERAAQHREPLRRHARRQDHRPRRRLLREVQLHHLAVGRRS